MELWKAQAIGIMVGRRRTRMTLGEVYFPGVSVRGRGLHQRKSAIMIAKRGPLRRENHPLGGPDVQCDWGAGEGAQARVILVQ